MVATLTQDVTALTAYLDRRRKDQRMCPLFGCLSQHPKTLSAVLHRYPYLYKRKYAANQDSEDVEQLQQRAQRRFDIRLSLYVIDQMRRSKFSVIDTELTQTKTSDNSESISNPTLISYIGVIVGLHRFTSKIWGTETHKDLAHRFLRQTQNNTFGIFKHSLYIYLMASIPRSYGDSHFPEQLWQCLTNLMPERNGDSIDRFLLTAVCRKLFQFLTVESAKNLEHYTLIDLVSNVNPLCVAELLLRILLLCPHSHVHLDKRMRILFEHYADHEQTDVRWLIQLLEYLNLAYSTNFGTVILPMRDCNKISDLFSVQEPLF